MPRTGVRTIPEGRLRLSRSPVAELAAAALQAQEAAELADGADFIIVAVPIGKAGDELGKLLQRTAEESID